MGIQTPQSPVAWNRSEEKFPGRILSVASVQSVVKDWASPSPSMKYRCILLAVFFATLVLGARGATPVPPSEAVTDNAPILQSWAPPAYPPEALSEKVEGTVKVRFTVDAEGHVTTARALESPDPRLSEAALAAVEAWGFTPGLEDGKPTAYCLDVPVAFSLAAARKKTKPSLLPPIEFLPQPAARTEAEPKVTPGGGYPGVLTERKIPGAVVFSSVVSAEGRIVALHLTDVSHVEFVLPALEALKHWEFTPALQGDLPVKSTVVGKVTFDAPGGSREEILAVNGLTAPNGGVPSPAPEPFIVVDPVQPFDLLMRGQGGAAVVEFSVSAGGMTTGVKVRYASKPEYGRALAAAVEGWTFHPAMSGGRAVEVPLVKHAEFKAVAPGKETETDPDERLVAALRAKQVRPAKNLDEKLTPLYRVAPGYPASLAGKDRGAGRTVIEFVIDREGRARLPRIVSATREEFGWAAATAVAQWVFTAPRRGGEPVDVMVQVPFDFAAPAN
jgi:TonB family protein